MRSVGLGLARRVTLGVVALGWASAAQAITWPGTAGYAGGAYALWIYDGTNIGTAAENDIIRVDLARDTAATNNFFFFRFLVRDQRNSQLTSVGHVAYIDTDGDGVYDYTLYNTTQGASESELTYWDTASNPDAWNDAPSPPAHVYSGYTRDADNLDNVIELAVPAADLGNPPVLLQAAAAGQGALNLDGNVSNGPSLDDFNDITEPRASEPLRHASNIVFTAVSTGSIALAWQNGSGSQRLVVAGTNAVSWKPVDLTTYAANADFAMGSPVGGDYKVVFNGAGTNVSVVGLSPATVYHFSVFEYNGVAPIENYYTNPTPASASTQTLVPTLAVIMDMRAVSREGMVWVQWRAGAEIGTLGYWLERLAAGGWAPVNARILPAKLTQPLPRAYEVPDAGAEAGGTYTYRLIELENTGRRVVHGPYTVTVDGPGYGYAVWAAGIAWGGAAAGRGDDPDGDRLTNLEEFLAGTDPLARDSVLRITHMRVRDGTVALSWRSAEGRVYAVEAGRRPNGPFLPVASRLSATPPVNVFACPLGVDREPMYYRVIVSDSEAAP